MKQRIIYTLLVSLFIGSIFAADFEGVVTQEVFDVNNGSYTMQWHIKGERLALEIIKDDASYFFIPSGGSILMYSDAASEFDGQFYYSKVSASIIESKLKDIEVYDSGLSKEVASYKTNSISLKGNYKGNVYFNNELFSSFDLSQYFKDSYELRALGLSSHNGIPMYSKISDDNGVISQIKTIKVEKSVVKEAIFTAPSNYINLPLGK